ncbi:MAG: hypothetical protein EAX96_17400 [Candidatus Lokiarchaeota archaeon]|nr:hypothetical protein [Candidatus Lokiarchaeota archaeon]
MTNKIIKSGIYKKGEISVEDLVYSLKKNPDSEKIGAIAIYNGVVRGISNSGEEVSGIIIESYVEKCNEILVNISKELKEREGIIDIIICHFIGDFVVGEDLVYVGISSGHRKELFPIFKEAIERYKTEGILWKKEKLVNGKEYWIEK